MPGGLGPPWGRGFRDTWRCRRYGWQFDEMLELRRRVKELEQKVKDGENNLR